MTAVIDHQQDPQSESPSRERDEPRTPPHSPLRGHNTATAAAAPSLQSPKAKDSFVMKANPKASPAHHNNSGLYYSPAATSNRGRSEAHLYQPTTKNGAHSSPQSKKDVPPVGPPMPSEVEKLSKMSARDRVKEGLRLMRSLQCSKPSATFRSHTERDPYNLNLHGPKSAQQLRKEAIEEEWKKSISSRSGSAQGRGRSTERKPGEQARGEAKRSSSWARDTTPRGNFMFNWTAMPQVVPKKFIDPTPGPGAYTPVLHFLGGTSH